MAIDWEPTKWWRVIAPDGSVWCETSDEAEARSRMREEDTLERLYQTIQQQWVVQ